MTLAEYNRAKKAQGINSPVSNQAITNQAITNTEESTNNGGFIGGIGYLGEKFAVGFVSTIENIWDFAGGGVVDLLDKEKWEKEQKERLENDWFGDWYSHPDEWFNPSGGWKTAGDVASGIGSSLPAIAAGTVATIASGGTLAPAAVALISASVGAASGAGAGLKEAYRETGELNSDTYLYAVGQGLIEGTIEGVSGYLGAGIGGMFSKSAVSATQAAGTAAAKSSTSFFKSIGKTMLEEALQEGFEEGVTEYVSPYLKRATYDPNAKNATAEEIAYSAFVGAMSGAVTGGSSRLVSNATKAIKGNKAVTKGEVDTILKRSKEMADYEAAHNTGYEVYQYTREIYNQLNDSLVNTNGKVKTLNQKMMLGDLKSIKYDAIFAPMMYKEGANIQANAEAYVERFNSYGIKDADGKVMKITVEELTKGYDKSNPKSIVEALKTNDTLRTITAMSLTGKIFADATKMENSILSGNRISNKADLAYLAEQSPETIERLSNTLGINDWTNVDEVNTKIDEYKKTDAYKTYIENAKYVEKIKNTKSTRNVPKAIAGLNKDGAVARYTDGTLDVGVARVGDDYIIYDFNQELQSRRLSQEEVNKFFKEYSQEKYSEAEAKRKETAEKRKAEVEEVDKWARDNVKDYAPLSASNKAMIRKVIREGRANGLSDADVRSYANVAAHSGLDIEFNESKCVKGDKVYAGYYDPNGNKIVVNPKAKKKHSALLIHELSHAIRAFKGIDNKIHYIPDIDEKAKISEDTLNAIEDAYAGQDVNVSIDELIIDEASAYYAEQLLGKDGIVDLLLGKKPSLAKKILNFFKRASKDYEGDVKLSREAKRQYKSFKKLFDAFSALNQGSNAYGGVNAESGGKRYYLASVAHTFFDGNTYMNSSFTITPKGGIIIETAKGRKKVKYIPKNFFRRDVLYSLQKQLDFVFADAEDAIASELGIEYKNAVVIVDSQKGEGRVTYQVREILEIEDDEARKIILKGHNYESKQRGNFSDQISSSLGDELLGNRESDIQREFGENTEDNIGESQNNKNGILEEDGYRIELDKTYDEIVYFDAIERGDEKTQERIIVETAKKAGYTVKAYHGTPNETFTEFDSKKIGSTTDMGIFGHGFYFSTNESTAKIYATEKGNVMPVFLNLGKTWWAVAHRNIQEVASELGMSESALTLRGYGGKGKIVTPIDSQARQFTSHLKEHGYNSVVVQHGKNNYEIVVFDSNQIKSADLITYDDNGNIILPSERFNTKNKDIRYSVDLHLKTEVMAEEPEGYKPTLKERVANAWTSIQMSVTNEQAGIEKVGKKLGIKDIDVLVQAVRASTNQAQMMLGTSQYRIGAGSNDEIVKQGDGLAKIFDMVGKGDEKLFDAYLLYWHNISRMSLDTWSQNRLNQALQEVDNIARELEKIGDEIKTLVKKKEGVKPRTKKSIEINKKLSTLRKKMAETRKKLGEARKHAKTFKLEANKPILANDEGKIVTADESKIRIAEIEKEHPEFKAIAEKVWAYSRNLNQYRVDTGLISQEDFDYLNEKYPYYVPTYRADNKKGIAPVRGSNNLAIKDTVKVAKGSVEDVLSIREMLARQTMETVRAGAINRLTKSLYDASSKNGEYVAEVSRKRVEDLEINPEEQRPKDNQITFYDNGDLVTLAVTKEIFGGYKGFYGNSFSDAAWYKGLNRANKLFKKLVTQWSPAFMIRNAIRDPQDAGINSKYGLSWAKNWLRVLELIAKNSEEWQMFCAMGGFSASYFDRKDGLDSAKVSERGFEKRKKRDNKVAEASVGWFLEIVHKIGSVNEAIEAMPRFAEFLASIEAGNSYSQAILDAADVTTNFGRTGSLTKVLNATIMPFLNPAIQGFSKTVRVFASPRTFKQFASLIIKATLIGITPQLINMLMYGDDEDYEELRENDKENNFLIKLPNGTFIKIPRGRVASAIGGALNRTVRTAEGKDAEWSGYIENVVQQATPFDSMTRTIFSPLYDLYTNTTWYGTEIEGRQFENIAPSDRYDESTSSIAKTLGKIFNYSPKKIHYLLDQYSGVVGDFILPMTSKKAEKDFFSGNFTIDPVTSNKLSSSFYKIYDEAQYAKSAGDKTAELQVRYLNTVKKAVSTLYEEKAAIENSSLNDADKLQQTRVIQALINQTFKTAINDFSYYTKAFNATAVIEDMDMRYIESIRLTKGAKTALETYNKDVAAKYNLIAKSGMDYNELYYYYFLQKDIESDVDKNGNVIAGSKKTKIVNLVNGLKANKNQKLLLLAASGYSVGDRATKIKLAKYIMSLRATKQEKIELAEMCGYKVKNGTILLSAIK